MKRRLPRVPRVRQFLYSLLIILSLLSIFYSTILLLGVDPTFLLGKIKGMLLRRSFDFLFSRLGWEVGLFMAIILALFDAESPAIGNMMAPSGASGASNSGNWRQYLNFSSENEGDSAPEPSTARAPVREAIGRDLDQAGPSSFTEDSFDVRVLLEPFSESETTGETSVNRGGSSRGSGWTSFDLGVFLDSSPNEEGEEVAQPHPQNAPANPVASRGEEAGPSNRVPPEEKFPYHPDEMIGGDSVRSIERRLLSKFNSPRAEDIYFAHIKAQDLFEIKVEIVRHMAGLDPEGNWLGRGARALDNPRTATGEPSLERLYALLEDLNRGGVQSETFSSLKNKVLSKGEEVGDDNSVT